MKPALAPTLLVFLVAGIAQAEQAGACAGLRKSFGGPTREIAKLRLKRSGRGPTASQGSRLSGVSWDA